MYVVMNEDSLFLIGYNLVQIKVERIEIGLMDNSLYRGLSQKVLDIWEFRPQSVSSLSSLLASWALNFYALF